MNITKTDANRPISNTQISATEPEESKVSAAAGPALAQAAQEMPAMPPREFTVEFNKELDIRYHDILFRLFEIKEQLEDRHEVLIQSLQGQTNLVWDDLALSGLETIENHVLHTIGTYYVLKKRDADNRLNSMSWLEYFRGGSTPNQPNIFSQLENTYDSYAEAFQIARRLRDPSSHRVRKLEEQYHENAYSVRSQPVTPTFLHLEALNRILEKRFAIVDLDKHLFAD